MSNWRIAEKCNLFYSLQSYYKSPQHRRSRDVSTSNPICADQVDESNLVNDKIYTSFMIKYKAYEFLKYDKSFYHLQKIRKNKNYPYFTLLVFIFHLSCTFCFPYTSLKKLISRISHAIFSIKEMFNVHKR